MELLAVYFFRKSSIIDVWKSTKYVSELLHWVCIVLIMSGFLEIDNEKLQEKLNISQLLLFYCLTLLFYCLFKHQLHKMVKHTQAIRRPQPTNCFECV